MQRKANFKITFVTVVLVLCFISFGNNGHVYAQENPDVIPVKTREIKRGRTINIANDAFYVILTTEKTPGETIALSLQALEGYEDDVWIDLNNNKRKDAGEEVTRLDNKRVNYDIQAQSVTVYGKITELNCSGNNLTAFTTSTFSFLEKIDCSSNQLKVLDVSRCNLLKELACNNNRLVSLKIGKIKALERLDCSYNRLASLNVRGVDTVEWIFSSGNNMQRKQMTALIKSLPSRNGSTQGKLIVSESYNNGAQNSLNNEQEKIAVGKNWEIVQSD